MESTTHFRCLETTGWCCWGGLIDGERDGDEEETNVWVREVEYSAPEELLVISGDLELQPDFRDLAVDELAAQDASSHKQHKVYLIVDEDQGGNTYQHKSAMLHLFSRNEPGSQDHLARVKGYMRFNQPGRRLSSQSQEVSPNEPHVAIFDPAAMLVHSKNLIWLAVVQIVDLHVDNSGVLSMPTQLMCNSNVRIKAQIM